MIEEQNDGQNRSAQKTTQDDQAQQAASGPSSPELPAAALASPGNAETATPPDHQSLEQQAGKHVEQQAEAPAAEEPVKENAAPQYGPALAAAGSSRLEARAQEPASTGVVPTSVVPGHQAADALVLAESRRHTRRSFAAAALAAAASYGFYYWLPRGRQNQDQPSLLRRTLEANAAISQAVFEERALAPTYPLSKAETLRVNGIYGLRQELVLESWRLQLVGARDTEQHPRLSSDVTAWEYHYAKADAAQDQGHDTKVAPQENAAKNTARMPRGQEEAGRSRSTLGPQTAGLLLSIEDLTKLPRHEMVTQFKCIEGWSQIVHWAGIRMADFLELYPPQVINGREPRYVYMETPNGDYYTGYEMHVMRHPQTLLVTEMMGAPLTQSHGAPLRLHMPTKYGYKQIKRIGLIAYTGEKPDDYWTKLGYDWYAGL